MLYSSSSLFLSIFIISSLCLVVKATVPPSKTFQYVNQGDFGEFAVEYFADYRVLPISTFPFTLCFYNTTPNAYTLGLRMGHRRSESIMRWVWDANRGNPVKENATLTFGHDGNLVLANTDGNLVWQTNTSNKGVVGLSLLGNGNLVLYSSKGKLVWESFNYPTDTLLVGQAFRFNGATQITSRVSSVDGSKGPYSYGIEGRYLVMYYKPKYSPKSLLYYRSNEFGNGQGALANLVLAAEPETEGATAFEIRYGYDMNNSPSSGTYILTRPKHNSTYSMLRVDFDGNLRIYTYDINVDYLAWEITYELFDGDRGQESECKLPKRCGSLGVCEDNQCVACPKPQGLLGWSKDCLPPVLPKCNGGENVNYYKVVGVEYFTYDYAQGDGSLKLGECKAKCDKDCKCLGFFYRQESLKCLVVYELGTFVKVANTSHVAYIKTAK